MQAKVQAQIVQAFYQFKSADGTPGLSATVAGITFKSGLYAGGTFSGAGIGTTFDNITILGTAGNGYVQLSAQSSPPSLGGAHIYATAPGRVAMGHSGTGAFNIIFANDSLTAHRTFTAPDKNGTWALTGDNVSQFTNDARYTVGPASATSGNIPKFNGTTGILIQDSGIATTSLVLTTRTITEGAGLAGNTYDLSANRTLAMGTPSTLSLASTNAASGTSHSHAITASSNPGAAASLLASDGSGFLTLPRLTATGYIFVNASTANLYLKDTSTGFQAATTGVVTLQSGNTLRSSSSFVSGVTGWNEAATGDAEFNNITARGEFRSSVFKVSEISATAGTFGVFYSASTLTGGIITDSGGPGFAFPFNAKNSDTGAMLFGVGDIIRLKAWNGSGIADVWGTILTRTNNGSNTDYTALQNSGGGAVIIPAGSAVIDYGPSGTGFITLSTDGTVGSSPNLTMATHAGSPWSAFTTLLRLGNLNGSYGYATDVYGLGIGQYGTASKSWVTTEQTNGFRIGNNTTTLIQLDTSGNATFGKVAASNANVYWNASNSRLEFRGSTSGTTVQSYIDTDGSFVAGGGNTKLDSSGLSLSVIGTGPSVPDGTTIKWGIVGEIGTESGAIVHITSKGGSAFFPNSGVTLDAVLYGQTLFGTGAHFKIDTNSTNAYARLFSDGSSLAGMTIGSNSTPTHMLDVYGTGWFQGAVTLAGGVSSNFTVTGSGSFVPTTSGLNLAAITTSGAFGGGVVLKDGSFYAGAWNDSSALKIGTGTSSGMTSAINISSAQAVRFPAYGAGTLSTDASGNITASSDEKLKTRIRQFRKGLETIKRLEPIIHRWNKKSGLDMKNDYVGLGARHTKKHLPEAIGKGQNGFHTMSDRVILATAINAIKELSAKVDALAA